MEDDARHVEAAALVKSPAEEEVGDDAEREGVRVREAMEELAEWGLEELGGEEEVGHEVGRGELIRRLAVVREGWVAREGEDDEVNVRVCFGREGLAEEGGIEGSGDDGDVEAEGGERGGEIQEGDYVALSHEREDHDVLLWAFLLTVFHGWVGLSTDGGMSFLYRHVFLSVNLFFLTGHLLRAFSMQAARMDSE